MKTIGALQILANAKLTATERRLLLDIYTEFDKMHEDKRELELIIPTGNYAEDIIAIQRLNSIQLACHYSNGYTMYFTLFSMYRQLVDDDTQIGVSLTILTQKHLQEIKQRYTKDQLELLLSINNKHTAKIYSLIVEKQVEVQGSYKTSLEEINEFLNTNYKNFNDINKRVFKTVASDLENYSIKVNFTDKFGNVVLTLK